MSRFREPFESSRFFYHMTDIDLIHKTTVGIGPAHKHLLDKRHLSGSPSILQVFQVSQVHLYLQTRTGSMLGDIAVRHHRFLEDAVVP